MPGQITITALLARGNSPISLVRQIMRHTNDAQTRRANMSAAPFVRSREASPDRDHKGPNTSRANPKGCPTTCGRPCCWNSSVPRTTYMRNGGRPDRKARMRTPSAICPLTTPHHGTHRCPLRHRPTKPATVPQREFRTWAWRRPWRRSLAPGQTMLTVREGLGQ